MLNVQVIVGSLSFKLWTLKGCWRLLPYGDISCLGALCLTVQDVWAAWGPLPSRDIFNLYFVESPYHGVWYPSYLALSSMEWNLWVLLWCEVSELFGALLSRLWILQADLFISYPGLRPRAPCALAPQGVGTPSICETPFPDGQLLICWRSVSLNMEALAL